MRMKTNVSNWERWASLALGAALVGVAAKYPRFRSTTATAGAGFLGRGLTGWCPVSAAIGRDTSGRRDDTRTALGGPRGVHVAESVTIRRRPEELFEFWRDLTHLPQFMPHIESVEVLGARHSHWVVPGPAGTRLEWDAEVINEVRPELIAWKSLPGADVASAGSVHFCPVGEGLTRLDVVLQYDPPAGKVGAAVARLLGDAPETTLRLDLDRLKRMLEAA